MNPFRCREWCNHSQSSASRQVKAVLLLVGACLVGKQQVNRKEEDS